MLARVAGRRPSCLVRTAHRIAANIAKLQELLKPIENKFAILCRGRVRDRAGKAPPEPGRAS